MLSLSTRPALRLAMCTGLVCMTCKQFMDPSRAGERVSAALFGASKYAMCPTCLQEVNRREWTHSYKCLWTRRVKEKQRAN